MDIKLLGLAFGTLLDDIEDEESNNAWVAEFIKLAQSLCEDHEWAIRSEGRKEFGDIWGFDAFCANCGIERPHVAPPEPEDEDEDLMIKPTDRLPVKGRPRNR